MSSKPIEETVIEHDTEIAILKTEHVFLKDALDRIEQQTQHLPIINEKLNTFSTGLEQICKDFSQHTSKHITDELAFTKQTTGLSIKNNILWYILFTLILGTLIVKIVLPKLGI
jgi:hypothetical protein